MKKILLIILSCFSFIIEGHAQSELIYHTDFDTDQDWKGITPCETKIDNGRIVFNPDRIKLEYTSIAITKDFPLDYFRDFSIETSMSVLNQGTGVQFGLVLGAEKFKTNIFKIFQQEYLIFDHYDGNAFVNYFPMLKFGSAKGKDGDNYKLKIEKIGSQYSLYVNDVLISKASNVDIYGSKIGFYVDYKQTIAVDYLTIKYLPENYNPNTVPNPVITKEALDEDELRKQFTTFYQDNKYDDGILHFTNVIKSYPTSSLSYYLRGFFYSQQSKYQLAIKDYTQSIALDKSDQVFQTYTSRADTYFSNKQYDLAINDYDESIRLNHDDNNNAFLGRGETWVEKELYDQAIADFSEAIRISPNFVRAYYGRTKTNKILGKYDLAIQDLKKCIEINSKLGDAYIGLLAPFARLKNFEQTKYYYQQYTTKEVWSVSSNPYWNFYQYYVTAAAENIPNGAYEQALVNLNKGITEYKLKSSADYQLEYTDMLSLKGYVLEKLSRPNEAIDFYNQSLLIYKNQPEVKLALSLINKKPAVLVKVDKTPPTISITSPAVTRGLNVVQKNKLIIVTGKATDESGIYEIMVNGVEAGVDALGNFSASIPLAFGDNQIMVSATDAKFNKASFNFIITRKANEIVKPVVEDNPIVIAKAEITPEGKFYALIIGVQDYADESINDLDMPVADASSLYQTLTSRYTFEPENVSLLKNPTRDELFESLENLSHQVKSTDNLLIFYAGHGYWDENRRQGYWFPSDARRLNRSSWLTNADLKEYINAIKSKHTLLISDACFSGGIFKSRSVMTGASRAVRVLYDLPSRKAMTSGTLKEVPDKSVFIEYLVKRLNQNIEKYLSAEQLFSSFRTAVINNSANGQVPQFGEIKEAGDEGGDFIFIRK
ncbi:MAG: hypothetical protein JWQ25_626 [Daejeonella sp.]|nr:hypothetical protein [Daejeonella sp.]